MSPSPRPPGPPFKGAPSPWEISGPNAVNGVSPWPPFEVNGGLDIEDGGIYPELEPSKTVPMKEFWVLINIVRNNF